MEVEDRLYTISKMPDASVWDSISDRQKLILAVLKRGGGKMLRSDIDREMDVLVDEYGSDEAALAVVLKGLN